MFVQEVLKLREVDLLLVIMIHPSPVFSIRLSIILILYIPISITTISLYNT